MKYITKRHRFKVITHHLLWNLTQLLKWTIRIKNDADTSQKGRSGYKCAQWTIGTREASLSRLPSLLSWLLTNNNPQIRGHSLTKRPYTRTLYKTQPRKNMPLLITL